MIPTYSLFQIIFLLSHYFANCRSIFKRAPTVSTTDWGYAYHAKAEADERGFYADDTTGHLIKLQDLRNGEIHPKLETEGFTFVSGRPVAEYENNPEYEGFIEDDSVKLVKELSGATSAIVIDTTFRGNSEKKSEGFSPSVPLIHSDMSPAGAQFIKDRCKNYYLESGEPSLINLGKHLEENKKVVILNVWRPIQTVSDNPLGFCKWNSLSPQEDALDYTPQPKSASASIQPWRYHKDQKWVYTSNQRPDEAYVFVQHESTGENGHGINVPHAAFRMLKDASNKFTRSSIECRVMAFFDPLPQIEISLSELTLLDR